MSDQNLTENSSDSRLMPSESDFGFTLAFHQKRKKGKFREVTAPCISEPVADTHAHIAMLSHPEYHLARCAYFGVKFICSITDPTESDDLTYDLYQSWQEQAGMVLDQSDLSIYKKDIPHIRLACGCHPHNASRYTEEVEQDLLAKLSKPISCGIGEIGLDYHYDLSPRAVQKDIFKRQISLAHKTGLPIFLHVREAHDDALSILKEEGLPEAGVLLHCFNLDKDVLKPWVECGVFVAYGGPLTFKKSDYVRESVPLVKMDHLLTETDSPYMTPEPLRGMECGPEHVIFTASVLADLIDSDNTSSLYRQFYRNALALQDRPSTPWQLSFANSNGDR